MPVSNPFAGLLAGIERRLTALERNSRLQHASIEDGTIPVYDSTGNLRQQIGKQVDGAFTVVDHNGPPPPTPAAPVVVPALAGLTITWDGTSKNGAMWPTDFRCIEVHVGTTASFTPDDTTQVAALFNTKGGQVLAGDLTAGDTYWVTLVAVSTSGTESPASTYVSGVPTKVVTQAQIDQINTDVTNAQNAADSAQNAATTAQQTADFKNSVFYNDVTAGDPVPTAHSTDDVWFKPDEGYASFRWDGSAWVQAPYGTAALGDSAITAQKIADFAVEAKKLNTTKHFIY